MPRLGLLLCIVLSTIARAPSAAPAAEPAPAAFAPLIAESNQRRDAAQHRLDHVRTLRDDLTGQRNALDATLDRIAQRLGVERDQQLAALRRDMAAAQDELKRLDAALRSAQPDAFTTLDQMLGHDKATDRRAERAAAIDDLARLIVERKHDLLRADAGAAPLLEQWSDLSVRITAASHEAAVAQADRDAASRAEGSLIRAISPRPEPQPDRTIRLDPAPPADAADRIKRFEQRRSPAGIQGLGRLFFSQMTLTSPGLGPVRRLVEAERYAEALDAYKRYFFDALQRADEPDRKDGEAVNALASLAPPSPRQLDDALAGLIAQMHSDRGKSVRIEANLGPPGAMRWTFLGPAATTANDDGSLLLNFCRQLGDPRAVGNALLASYAIGGPAAHLQRWCDIADDWALNWRRDAEASPLPLRDYNLLYVCRIQALRTQLRAIARMRPSFVDDLPADSLARLLMAYNEEYLASAIRLGRAGLYNFRIMALLSMLPTSLRMQEFGAHQWALGEAWRQIDNNFIYKIRRDGANFEFANDGHENTDQAMLALMHELRRANPQPDWLDPHWDAEFLGRFKANARYWVHNLKPDGFSYRLNARSQLFRYAGQDPEYKINLLADEDEVRRRMWHIYGIGRPEPLPSVRSESLAFQGYYYLRSGWKPHDLFVYFQSIGQPILSGREDDTGLSMYGHGGIHLLAPAPTVDQRTQFIHEGLVYWPGGKAPYATFGRPAPVQEGRFHAGERFDLAEGEFRGVYRYRKPDRSLNIFGHHGYEAALAKAQSRAQRDGTPLDDSPVTDARQSRQVLAIHGRQTYIITDFFHSDQPHHFAQDYTIYTPTRRDHLAARLRLLQQADLDPLTLDTESRTLATHNLGLPNLAMRHVSGLPLTYKLHPDRRREQALAAGGDLALAVKAMDKRDRQEGESSGRVQFSRHVTLGWQSQGPAALITLITPLDRRYSAEPSATLLDLQPLAPRNDTAGFTARFADGAPIAYAASTQPADLTAGPVRARAAGLLLVADHGVALDCTLIAIGDHRLTPHTPDFTFRVEAGRIVIDQPIYRPIQPVVIEPPTNVFIDSQRITLRCDTPGVDIRYTLDGSRPTPASTLYTTPFSVDRTCRLQARAFRKGVDHDIWQQDGTHATAISDTVLVKQEPIPAASPASAKPGLRYEYFTGVWTHVMTNSPTAPAQKSGVCELLDVSMRDTDGAFGVRYDGFIDVPRDGVYTFYAPREFTYPDNDCGYDLRLLIADRLWYPAVRWHAHGSWSIALAKGKHPFKLIFADLRLRPHKTELMWGFPHPDFTWKGTAPTLEYSGPDLPRQPIPASRFSQ